MDSFIGHEGDRMKRGWYLEYKYFYAAPAIQHRVKLEATTREEALEETRRKWNSVTENGRHAVSVPTIIGDQPGFTPYYGEFILKYEEPIPY
jgi:hypothetical protein